MLRTLHNRGCELAYRVEGQGPPVVFIQGVGLHGRGWAPQTSELSERFQCLTFDNRGMGASQPIGASITVAQMADDTICLLDALGWPSAHFVGHSLGGPVALEVAFKVRARIRSLSLLCTVARGRDATRLTRRILWLGVRSRIGSRRQRRRAFLELVLDPADAREADRDLLAAELEPLFGHDLAEQPPIAMKQLAALRAYDASARLSDLGGIPTLVVSASHDPIAPPEFGRRLAAGIAGARYVELSDASHGLPIRRAAAVNSLLAAHISEADQRWTGTLA
jgi:pimeloyl-ACP methyl ester carboxylesterase